MLRLGVSPTLARTLRSTNSIEKISICRNHSRNVKNWQNDNMAPALVRRPHGRRGKQFRRINGHMHLPSLRITLDLSSPWKPPVPSVMMNP